MDTSLFVRLALAIALASPSLAAAADPVAVEKCRRAVLSGLAADARGQVSILGRCLKTNRYDTCPVSDYHSEFHETELVKRIAGASSACQAALDSGSVVSDFGPATCTDEWGDCDVEVPAIATLDDLAACLVCQQRGFNALVRDTFGMPRAAPVDRDENRCDKRIAKLVTTTVRLSIFDADKCSKGGIKPFACPVDVSTDTRFGRALATFGKKIASCGIDAGKAPGALVNLCNGAATNSAGLTTCFTELAKCLACRTTNSALEQSQDCIAFSGLADCDGMF